MRRWFVILACVVGACGGEASDGDVTFVTDGGATDEGGGPIPSGVDPFAGAPAFTPGSAAATSLVAKHLDEVGKSPTGQNCFASGCHGSSFDAPSLLFGGTVYQSADPTKGAVGVEIRVVDANGTARSTYSDSNGNFYIRSAGAFGLPAHPGVRNAAGASVMVGDMTVRGCNAASCHDGTADFPRIIAP